VIRAVLETVDLSAVESQSEQPVRGLGLLRTGRRCPPDRTAVHVGSLSARPGSVRGGSAKALARSETLVANHGTCHYDRATMNSVLRSVSTMAAGILVAAGFTACGSGTSSSSDSSHASSPTVAKPSASTLPPDVVAHVGATRIKRTALGDRV
jgi:hypothetical protein